MSIGLILQVLNALLKFPSELAALIRLLEKSPAQRRAELVVEMEKKLAEYDSGSRPTWDV